MMTTTIEKGDITDAMVLAACLRARYVVLKPVSVRHRYDLVIDRGKGFERVQCKTGRLVRGSIRFRAHSSQAHWKKGRHSYRGQIELFGVYCPDNDRCYLVPVDDVPETIANLRVEATKNKQATKVRFAAKYEMSNARAAKALW